MWKLLVPFLLLAGMLVGAVVIDRPLPPADFVLINRADVATLDLNKMSWMQDLRVASEVYEGLVKPDVFSRNFDIKPAVAERWEVSPDGRTYTFFLRQNAKWNNGEPVRARDFIFAWRRGMLPETQGDYVTMYQLVRGGRAFTEWRESKLKEFETRGGGQARPEEAEALWKETLEHFDRTVGLRAPDDRTLIVELERPVAYMMQVFAYEVMGPLYAPLVEQYQRIDPVTGRLMLQSGWTRPGTLVSNGPYQVAVWRFKRDMRLEVNPHYWNTSAQRARTIDIPSVSDPNAAVLATQTGTVDWLSDVVPDYRADLLRAKREYYAEHRELYESLLAQGLDPVAIDRRMPRDPRQNIHAFPAFGTYWMNINCLPKLKDGRDNPFADPRVRRAFAMAVDKQNIADNVRRIGERPARTIIPPGSLPGYESPAGLPSAPDPAAITEARRLLAEAGYPGGRGFITVEILFNHEGGHGLIAQALKKDWEQNLGVNVSLAQKEIKVFREELRNQQFIISRSGWFGDYGDPTTFLDLNLSFDGNNDRKYNSAEYDAMLARAADEADPAERLKILSAAERLLVEQDLPMIPLFHYNMVYMFDPHTVSGVSPHPRQKQSVGLMHRLDRPNPDAPPVAMEIPPASK
ncbi:MAG: peptide ABC transporter substrate-binding protein [Phycisphaerales bacterium]